MDEVAEGVFKPLLFKPLLGCQLLCFAPAPATFQKQEYAEPDQLIHADQDQHEGARRFVGINPQSSADERGSKYRVNSSNKQREQENYKPGYQAWNDNIKQHKENNGRKHIMIPTMA